MADLTSLSFITCKLSMSLIWKYFSVLGGNNITIVGINLPVNPTNVMIGNTIVNVISSKNTELIVQSPALPPGLYYLLIPSSLGNAL